MKILILKNIQNDFMTFGATPIEGADAFITLANKQMERYKLVVAIQKWYPADYELFAANHPWRKPGQTISIGEQSHQLSIIHCVADSFGAAFPPGLNKDKITHIIKDEGKDGDLVMAQINEIVKQHQVEEIDILGPEEKKD